MRQALIIGIGNPDRGDDGVGPFVARLIAERPPPGVEAVACSGDPADLIALWQEAECIVAVDACQSGVAPGTIREIDAHTDLLPEGLGAVSTHGFGLAAAVELARTGRPGGLRGHLAIGAGLAVVAGMRFIAGIELRDELLLEAQRLSRGASDEDARDIIRVATSRFEYLQKESPADCARHAEGKPLEVVKDFPHDLLKAETDLLIQLFEAPQTAENRRAASEKEVLNWTLNVATLEPEVAKLVDRLAQEKRGKAANAEICDGTIALYKRLSYRKGETRGTLLRGMALLALQRDQIRRNIAGESSEETA